jgi:hypothetical protein
MSPNARPLRAVAGVALWLIDLDARDHAEPALSPEEEARAAHFTFERDRGRYFAAHRALRRLLATQSGLDARALRFVAGPFGKPALDGAPRCRFSLAACDDVAWSASSPAARTSASTWSGCAWCPTASTSRRACSRRPSRPN